MPPACELPEVGDSQDALGLEAIELEEVAGLFAAQVFQRLEGPFAHVRILQGTPVGFQFGQCALAGVVGADVLVNTAGLVATLRMKKDAIEVAAIEDAIAKADGNKSQAGRTLGISRFALQRKLEKYGWEGGDSSTSREEA